MTYADKIREMTDKQLAKFLKDVEDNGFPEEFCISECPKKKACPIADNDDTDCPYNIGYASGWLSYLQETIRGGKK